MGLIPDVSSPRAAVLDLARVATPEGVSPTLKVLYLPDYVPPPVRVSVMSKLTRQLSHILPTHTISLAIAEGPFEDDHGVIPLILRNEVSPLFKLEGKLKRDLLPCGMSGDVPPLPSAPPHAGFEVEQSPQVTSLARNGQ